MPWQCRNFSWVKSWSAWVRRNFTVQRLLLFLTCFIPVGQVRYNFRSFHIFEAQQSFTWLSQWPHFTFPDFIINTIRSLFLVACTGEKYKLVAENRTWTDRPPQKRIARNSVCCVCSKIMSASHCQPDWHVTSTGLSIWRLIGWVVRRRRPWIGYSCMGGLVLEGRINSHPCLHSVGDKQHDHELSWYDQGTSIQFLVIIKGPLV